ncbi:hypothetical protein THAOC_23044, partial [Thalassiosira oceanica]
TSGNGGSSRRATVPGRVTVGLLDSSGRRGGLASGLGGELLAGGLSSGGLAGGLLRSGHFDGLLHTYGKKLETRKKTFDQDDYSTRAGMSLRTNAVQNQAQVFSYLSLLAGMNHRARRDFRPLEATETKL